MAGRRCLCRGQSERRRCGTCGWGGAQTGWPTRLLHSVATGTRTCPQDFHRPEISAQLLPAGRLMVTASRATERRAHDLSVSFAGIQLKNPVIAASGTFGYGIEFEDVVHLDKLGGFVVKGLSREPMAGNPPPRLYETPAGML